MPVSAMTVKQYKQPFSIRFNTHNFLETSKSIFANNLKNTFCIDKAFGRSTRATMMHHLTLKKVHIDRPFFSKPILLIYFRALLS